MQTVEHIFYAFLKWAILIIEAIGVCVLLYSIVHSVVDLFRRSPHVKVELAEGISLALGFKLGGEVLRTVMARTWDELLVLGAIVLLRGMIMFMLHWEIKNENEKGFYSEAATRAKLEQEAAEERDG